MTNKNDESLQKDEIKAAKRAAKEAKKLKASCVKKRAQPETEIWSMEKVGSTRDIEWSLSE